MFLLYLKQNLPPLVVSVYSISELDETVARSEENNLFLNASKSVSMKAGMRPITFNTHS